MEQLEKMKTQNRERQKRFYINHKEELNEKRRQIYKIGRARIQSKKQTEPQPVESTQSANIKVDFSNSKRVTYQETIDALNQIVEVKGSLTTYESSLKRLMKLSDCKDDLLKCFRDYKKLIGIIESSTKSNGEPYSDNTRKGIYQMILKVIDTLHLNITPTIKSNYSKKFDLYKIESNDNTEKKKAEQTISTFDDYIDKVRERFGVISKMFTLVSLYKEVTLRDDFVLKIVPTLKDASDVKENYIVINKKDESTLIINHYKTSKKYGQIKVKLSNDVSRLIRNYRQDENIKYGDYLFGSSNLSQYLNNENKKIGITKVGGGINYMRKMSVSDLNALEPSAEKRAELAAKMKHSPLTQLKYLRKQDKK